MFKRNVFLCFICSFCLTMTKAQELKPYQIYNRDKDSVSFGQMISGLSGYEIVLFGEMHNDAIIHWLELKAEKALFQRKDGKLILGAEMFERDNQPQVDSFLSGTLNEKELKGTARLWPNFHTDYKPLLDFAREHRVPFIATNVPRRYAAIVAKNGPDTLNTLPENEKVFMARLPVHVDMKTPGYPEMMDMIKDHAGDKAMDFVAAQAIKDATMAESILKNRRKRHLFLHFNGNYHSKEYGGIYWYLKQAKKKLRIAVISVIESDAPDLGLPAGFVPTEFNIVVPSDMTKTY